MAGKRSDHACVGDYPNALVWIRERLAGRA